ncbi:hypothetical protein KDW99_11535 [Marinomonas rhizomae]|uniref:site-specific integrase n=1 Tax=Marinomonas rhizomae TaxID=491948 RepID=UPI0021025091|nr:site-specific integrase [Marinomonas rhizomae]UTV97930.1 hypothetical protein KDW99_11535 [Marinomonas rhizomae]
MINKQKTFLTAPIDVNVTIINPSQCVLKVHGKHINIGALCYLKRQKNNTGYIVNESSISKERFSDVRKLIHFISDLSETSMSIVSIKLRFNNFAFFVDWCDKNSRHNALKSFEEARDALASFISYLLELVKTQKLHNNTAARYQYDVIIVFRDCFGYESLEQGLNLLKKSNRATTNTASPDERDQGKVLAISLSLFNGFCKEILNNGKYPFLISLPKDTGFENNQAWVFPIISYAQHPSRRDPLEKKYKAYNYKEGRLNSVNEIQHHFASKQLAVNSIRIAQQILEKNETEGTSNRLSHASIAMNAFLILFVANTGMNWSEVCKLTWRDSYEVDVESQGFREIKYRAFDRTVTFIITSSFLPHFKKYLKLRDYAQRHTGKIDLLFFTLNKKSAFKPHKLAETRLTSICKSFQLFDPSLPIISAKEWRATKSDYLVRNTDLQTASVLLQSDERTVLDHYTKGSRTKGISEISNFLERVVSKVKQQNKDNLIAVEAALGKCDNPGNPSPENAPPIIPDCKKGEGCLFCSHYGVHADEIDIRKLYSFKFCIESTSHLSESVDYYLKVFGAVLERIDALLKSFKGLSDNHNELVVRVENEVYNDGDLDPYWETKYEQLLNLGVI